MKPRNFPARKKARQVGAKLKLSVLFIQDNPEVQAARSIRTKKNRG